MNVRPAASTIVGAWVSTELTVSAIASAANADVAPAKLLDAGVAATPLTVIDQMRSGDSSGEEWLATVLLGCAAQGAPSQSLVSLQVWSDGGVIPRVSRFAQNGSPDESRGRFLRAAQR